MNDDWIGWQKTKRFFSNQDFVWFDSETIRNERSLSSSEIAYLRSWTVSSLGYASIFYLGFRKLYDLITVYIALYLLSEVIDAYKESIFRGIDALPFFGSFFALMFLFFSFIIFLISIYVLYFTLRHSRRLSWNRGTWTSVEELKKSELRWFYFSTLPSLAFIALAIWLGTLVD